jgi:hypothetical protein
MRHVIEKLEIGCGHARLGGGQKRIAAQHARGKLNGQPNWVVSPIASKSPLAASSGSERCGSRCGQSARRTSAPSTRGGTGCCAADISLHTQAGSHKLCRSGVRPPRSPTCGIE